MHALTFDGSARNRGVTSIPRLQEQLFATDPGWVRMGRFLHDVFPESDGVTIGVTPAGAIPYYSRLPAVDMLGLNDRWIAKHGALTGNRPGHQRMSTLAYLLQRRANLIIGHPFVLTSLPRKEEPLRLSSLTSMFNYRFPPDLNSVPAGTQVLALPYDPPRYVLAIYLVRSSIVDRAIERRNFRVFDLLIDTARPDGVLPQGVARASIGRLPALLEAAPDRWIPE